MAKKTYLSESDLAGVAKKMRQNAGKRKIQMAREFSVSAAAVFSAEEKPETPMTKLRVRIIEATSSYRVVGPVFYLAKK